MPAQPAPQGVPSAALPASLLPRHMALAVLVAAVWGLNFVLIDVGLKDFPPLLFCALRFTVVAVPAVFLVGGPGWPGAGSWPSASSSGW